MEAVAPKTNEPVAPPGMVERIIPPANPGPNAVAQVVLEYPERFKQIIQDVSTVQQPESRVRLAEAVVKHNEETETYRPNQKTQWDKVLVNVLSRNYNEALKWFNGGGDREVEARDMNNNLYFRIENDLGFTGRIKNREGKFLSNAEMKELDNRGGVFTSNDDKALKTLAWQNAAYNSELANKGLTSALQLATNDAYNAARTAGSANQNIDEQLQLTQSLRPTLDYISKLPAERRQKLLGYISRLNQIGQTSGTSAESQRGASAGGQQQIGGSANIGLGGTGFGDGGFGQGGPGGVSGRLSGGVGVNTMSGTQTGATGREQTGATTGASSSLQEQQNLQSAIMQELQGIIKSPEQFQQFMRLQNLNAANDAVLQNIPAHALPPTWNSIPGADATVSGADALIANRVNQQRNNALMAAWTKELFAAQRQMAKTGQAFDRQELSEKFQNSDVFKAINNTFEYKMKSQLSGRQMMPPKGSLMVNNRNEIKFSPGD
jgi:hypothetical protein